jgi:hypothetical protein
LDIFYNVEGAWYLKSVAEIKRGILIPICFRRHGLWLQEVTAITVRGNGGLKPIRK